VKFPDYYAGMWVHNNYNNYAKSGTARTRDRLNGFKKGKTQQFNSGGVVKWAYFQKSRVSL